MGKTQPNTMVSQVSTRDKVAVKVAVSGTGFCATCKKPFPNDEWHKKYPRAFCSQACSGAWHAEQDRVARSRRPVSVSTSPDVAYEISTGDTYSKHDWARDQAQKVKNAEGSGLDACETCHGDGFVNQGPFDDVDCPDCKGTGWALSLADGELIQIAEGNEDAQ